MFLRKNWLPVSIFIVAIAVVCIYLLQTHASKAPIRIYKIVKAAPKPPPQGETTESGHWHGDAWHAEPHEPVNELLQDVEGSVAAEFQKDVISTYPSLETSAAVQEFLTTAAPEEIYARVRDMDVARHYEKYPNCQEHEAVLEDAARFSKWYLADLEHRKKEETLRAESKRSTEELLHSLKDGFEEFTAYVNSLSEKEKLALLAEEEAKQEKDLDLAKRIQALRQERPVQPKPRHTH